MSLKQPAILTTPTTGQLLTGQVFRYDADGIRVSQAVTTDADSGGSLNDETPVVTQYLYDKQNPTGYAQILEEKDDSGAVTKTYTLGNDVIAQQAPAVQSGGTLYLLYDGHGSTRSLVDATGQIINANGASQVFRYDAFGNRLDSVNAITTLLYSGEQTDSTGLQYLRNRLGYDPRTGRFLTMDDPLASNNQDPQSLHKYLYCHADPVNGIDPSGQFFELLSWLGDELQFQADRAMAGLSALRQAYGIQRLVSLYQTTVSAYAEIGFKAAELLVRAGPTIRTVTTISGVAFVTSTIELACEEFGFVPRTGYTEFVVAASGTLFTGGLALGEISNELRGIVAPLRGTKDGRLLTGDMANRESMSRNPSYTALPYRPYTPAAEGTLAPGTRLVRFWRPGVADREGAFTTFLEDAQGLSYADIQRKFSLPYLPTNHCYANGSGARAVVGIAGRNFDMPGNGRQVELLDWVTFFDP